MALPDGINEMTRAQYEFYKAAGRLSKLWYVLTWISLIIMILSILISCVGAILALGPLTIFFNSLFGGLTNPSG